MKAYSTRPHIGCDGNLSYEKTIVDTIVTNKREVKRFGMPPKTREITKDLYRCDKCNDLVNIIICPSWEDYVLRGKIRVSKQEYWAIKNDRKRGAVRL